MDLDPEIKKRVESLGYWITVIFMVVMSLGVLTLASIFMLKLIMHVWNGVQ